MVGEEVTRDNLMPTFCKVAEEFASSNHPNRIRNTKDLLHYIRFQWKGLANHLGMTYTQDELLKEVADTLVYIKEHKAEYPTIGKLVEENLMARALADLYLQAKARSN